MLATRLRCVRTAPFETPVVPPVYWRNAMSVFLISCGVKPREAPFASAREADRVRMRIGRHHLLHVLHDEVDERALEEGEEVAHGGRHDVAAVGVGQGAFEGLREVFDDDDRFGAGVLQRVVNFARRVERVDVHDDEARAQARVDGDDVLKEVRHHDGDAVAGSSPSRDCRYAANDFVSSTVRA